MRKIFIEGSLFMQSVKTFLYVFFAIALLTGCQNTMEGFGKDMQHAGKEIQKSANSTD